MIKKLFFSTIAILLISLSSNAQSISMIGDAVSGWSTDVVMSTTDNVNFTLSNFTFSNGGAKFRKDASWSNNWGSTSFPSGTAYSNGSNIPVTAGKFNVSFNINTGAFSFTTVATGYDAISISGTGGPGSNADASMLTTDGVNYSLDNYTLTSGTLIFRKNNSSTTSWGSSSFPTGTASQGGAAIITSAGTYDIKFNKTTGAYSFTFAKIGIIGSATSGGWNTDTQMSTTDGVNYSLDGVVLTTGELKFRLNQAWTVSWGASTFPMGTATLTGNNISVVAGTYSVTFNKNTGAFNFSAGYPVVSLFKTGETDINFVTVDGINYYLNNYSIAAGNYIFRKDGSSATTWGANAFPTGTATLGGATIPVVAGDYNIAFNKTTGAYSFNYLTISVIGSATPGGWNTDSNLTTTDGVNYKLSGLVLIQGDIKFRQGNDWSVNWGGTVFPGGTAYLNSSNIGVTSASTFTVTFNRSTGAYYFYDEVNLQVNTPVTLCKGAIASSLSSAVHAVPGSVLKWYTAATGGVASLTAPSPATSVLVSKTYYVSQTIGTTEGPRVAIVVNVVAIPTAPTTLTGTAAQGPLVGTTTTATYSTTDVTGATSYLWTVPTGVTIVSGQGTTSVVVNFNNVTAGAGSIGTISVQSVNANGCNSAAKTLALTKALPAAPAAIVMTDGITTTAITSFAKYMGTSTTLTLTATPSTTATSYDWELPAGVNQLSGSNSNVITVNFLGVTSASTLTDISTNVLRIGVKSRNGVGTSTTNNAALTSPTTTSTAKLLTLSAVIPTAPASITITDPASTTPTTAITVISKYVGTTTPVTLTAPVSALASSYEWELPAGVNVVSGNYLTDRIISINFAGIGQGVTSYYIGVKAKNGIGYSVTNNSTLVPATLSTAKLLKVTTSLPAAVTTVVGQIVNLCGGTPYTYTITDTALANSYTVTAPAGSVVNYINKLTFTVTYPAGFVVNTSTSVANKSLVITSVNGVGSSATSKTLTLGTTMAAIAAVTGGTTYSSCNQTFAVASIVGATSYTWTVPTGATIINGQGTNSVVVNYGSLTGSQTIKVLATNGCGASTAIKSVTLTSGSCPLTKQSNESIVTSEISVYPNPVKEEFNIALNATSQGQMEVTLFSINGVIISSKNIPLLEGTNVINENVSSLAAGIYFVKLTYTSTNETTIKKLIKE